MSDTYVEQIGDSLETFSDRASKMGGVTVKPKRPWSSWYRKCVREMMALNRSDPENGHAADMAYVHWYMKQYGQVEVGMPYGPGDPETTRYEIRNDQYRRMYGREAPAI